MSFKEEILCNLFGGGVADYDMLEKCNYDFQDILDDVSMFVSRDEMDFNDILLGAIDIFRQNIENAIINRIEKIDDNIKYLENKIDCCAYDKRDNVELADLWEEKEKLENLDVYNDIEYSTNYLDTHIFITNDETKDIYKKYLSEEINEENENIGFVELDLD